MPDTELVEAIKTVIADMPTYGYRRVHAILRRQAKRNDAQAPNHKRVYRVMKEHDLLLQRSSRSAPTGHPTKARRCITMSPVTPNEPHITNLNVNET